ncbi:TPA: hypothetical protein N0F65_012872 [Lagenidium giganteum]|uniref:Temptin Cys/Cys disulfide domain-containing protein n=1 Tax=Lagenidium giganteum TaxID=4803 RepID=A0AAV2YKP7_9STRA|nr:TPA: hypothetical protein N0F65_012872 [Lagenidium giganteum]
MLSKIVFAATTVAVAVTPAYGYEKFLAQIPNGSNFGKKLGHSGDGYTDFGKLWKESGSWATACKKNYPGTSLTCGAVLGDPCCKWTSGKPDFELREPNMSGTKCAAETPKPSAGPSTAPSTAPSNAPATTAPGKPTGPTSAPTPAASKNGTTPVPTTPGSKAPVTPATPSPSKPKC